jgi:hypothetical protein
MKGMRMEKLEKKIKGIENAWTSYLFKEAYKKEMEKETDNYYSKKLKGKREMTLDEKLSVIWQLYLRKKAAFWRNLPENIYFGDKQEAWKEYLFKKAYGYDLEETSRITEPYLKEQERFLEREIKGRNLEKVNAYAKTGFVLEWLKSGMSPEVERGKE